jgi:hypothetical protein
VLVLGVEWASVLVSDGELEWASVLVSDGELVWVSGLALGEA